MGFLCRDSNGREFRYSLDWNQSAKSGADWILRHYAGEDLICEMVGSGDCTFHKSKTYKAPYIVI